MQQTRVCSRTKNSRSVSQQKIPFMNFFVVNNFITSCNGVGRNRSELMHDAVDLEGAAAGILEDLAPPHLLPHLHRLAMPSLGRVHVRQEHVRATSPTRLSRRRRARGKPRGGSLGQGRRAARASLRRAPPPLSSLPGRRSMSTAHP